MEIDLENMIISEEQAHRFAVDIYNDVIKYFQELDEYCNQLYHHFDELVSKAVCTLDGEVIICDNFHQYNLCKYVRVA